MIFIFVYRKSWIILTLICYLPRGLQIILFHILLAIDPSIFSYYYQPTCYENCITSTLNCKNYDKSIPYKTISNEWFC